MTDLFESNGITPEGMTGFASSAPGDRPDPITAPHIDLASSPAAQTASPPAAAAPAPSGNPVTALFGDDVPTQGFRATLESQSRAPSAPINPAAQAPAGPRDLFSDMGVQPPSITTSNQNAFDAGVAVSTDPSNIPSQPPAVAAATDQAAEGWKQFLPSADKVTSAAVADNANPNLMMGEQPLQESVGQYSDDQGKMLDQLASTRFTPQQLEDMKGNKIGFSEAYSRLHNNQIVPGGGISQAYNAVQLLNIATKMKNGEPVTAEDQNTMNQYINDKIEERVRGYSWGGNVAYVGAQIPAFVAEFAAAGGIGKLAGVGTVMSAEALAERTTLQAALDGATNVALRTALMPAQYAPKYAERRLNDISAVTDKGDLVFKDSTESPAQSAMLAYAHTSADVAAQIMAPGIGKYVIDPATKAVSTPLVAAVNQLPAATKDAFYQAYKLIQPNAQVSKVFTAAGWSGMLEQLGANRVSEILHTTIDATNQPMTMDDYLDKITPSKDQLLVEGGLVGIAGGIHTSSSVAFNLLRAKGLPTPEASETVANMSANEKDQYVADNLPTPKSTYPEGLRPDIPFSKPEEIAPDQTAATSPQHASDVDEALAADAPSPEAASIAADAPEDITRGQISSMELADPPPVDAPQSGFNAKYQTFKADYLKPFYAEMLNDLQPIQDLSRKARDAGAEIPAGERSELLAGFARSTPEWIRRNQMVGTTEWDSNGNQVSTGKGLKPIYDDFDNMFLTTEPDLNTRHADLNDYLIAERLEEEDKSSRDVLVTDDQKQFIADTMTRLADKYGDNFKFFDTFAGEIRDWDNRILHNLVTSGLKSQAWYDQTINQRSKYSPLNRVVDEEKYDSITRKGFGKDPNANNIGTLKQFKGSDLAIADTFQSRLKSSALIMQKSAVNKLRGDIAKYKDFYPADVKVSDPAIIRRAVTASFDPKLRQKLELAADFFSHEIKREQSVKVKGFKGVLGSYSPSEKMVRLKIGTTEGTLAHEIGHMLDYSLKLKERMLGDPEVKKQLQQLAQDRIGSDHSLHDEGEGVHFREQLDTTTDKYQKYISNDREILANFYDAYVNSPDQAKKTAPAAVASFEKIIADNPQLAFLKVIKPSTSRAEEVIQREERDMEGPANSVPFYQEGKRKYLELSPEIAKAFNNMKPIEMGMVEKFLGGIFRTSAKVLKEGATSFPDFMLRHFYRAIETSFLNTKGYGDPISFGRHVGEVAKGVFDVLGKSDAYHAWKSSSGGFQTFMDLSPEGLEKMQKQAFTKNGIADFINPLKWLSTLKNTADQAPRVAVFKKLKAQGLSDLEAGLASLEATGNYGRHGSFVKRVNQYAPFFNDMMQGGDRLVRSIAKNPAAFSLRALGTITMPQLLLTGYYLYAADDETREEYLNLPEWRKAIAMNIKIGNTWIPLPRAFGPGFIFGAMPERIMLHMHGAPEAKRFWQSMISDAATSVSPVFDWSRAMNPIFKAAIEATTNYSFFKGSQIFTGDRNKKAPEDQYNQYTSETAKLVGKLFGISPANIDNTVYDMSAKAGKYALQLSDYAISQARKADGIPVAETARRETDNPIYGSLVEETPRGTQTSNYAEFHDHVNDVSQAHNLLKNANPQDASQIQQQNARPLSQYHQLISAQQQIFKLERQAKSINLNTNMSVSDKTKAVNALQDQITRISTGANKAFRAATKTGD